MISDQKSEDVSRDNNSLIILDKSNRLTGSKKSSKVNSNKGSYHQFSSVQNMNSYLNSNLIETISNGPSIKGNNESIELREKICLGNSKKNLDIKDNYSSNPEGLIYSSTNDKNTNKNMDFTKKDVNSNVVENGNTKVEEKVSDDKIIVIPNLNIKGNFVKSSSGGKNDFVVSGTSDSRGLPINNNDE